ncbi:hypothetical protein HDU86_006387 [Geranomyces michiganensis]|nr:hypothetical protein HDU86_006387 [Geranomyces michiganensis]
MPIVSNLDYALASDGNMQSEEEHTIATITPSENKKRKPAKSGGRKPKKVKTELPSEHDLGVDGLIPESVETAPVKVKKPKEEKPKDASPETNGNTKSVETAPVKKPKKETPMDASAETNGNTQYAQREKLNDEEAKWFVEQLIEMKRAGRRVNLAALYEKYTAFACVPLSVVKRDYNLLSLRAERRVKKHK